MGTLPGLFIGYYLRVLYLPDRRTFKLLVGLVLLYVGAGFCMKSRDVRRKARQH